MEILKDDKTTDWIVIDYARFIKVIQQVVKDVDTLLKNKFNRYTNIKNYNTKMCRNYLSLQNLKIPDKLKDKQDTINKYQDSIKEK